MNFNNPFENIKARKLRKLIVGDEFATLEGSNLLEQETEHVVITAINPETGILTYKNINESNTSNIGTNISYDDFLKFYE